MGERVASSKKKKIREVRDVSFDSPYGDVVEARGKESEEARVEGYGKRPVAVMDSVRQRCPQEKTGENNLESDRRTNLQMRARRTTDELVFFKIFKIDRARSASNGSRTNAAASSLGGGIARKRGEPEEKGKAKRMGWLRCRIVKRNEKIRASGGGEGGGWRNKARRGAARGRRRLNLRPWLDRVKYRERPRPG